MRSNDCCCYFSARPLRISAAIIKAAIRFVLLVLPFLFVSAGSSLAAAEPVRAPALLSEQQALNEVLLSGPRAAAIRSQLGISKSAYAQATVLPNPAIEFDNGFAELTFRLGLAIPIEPPWKLVLRLLAAKQQIRTATLQMQQLLWTLRGECRRSYTEIVVANESESMMRELTELTRQLAEVAQKRFQVGDVARLDVFKAELAEQQAEIDANQATRRVIQAREQLNIIMGRFEDSRLEVPKLPAFQLRGAENDLLPDLSKQMPPLSQYIDDAIRNRLEIKIVKQEIVTNKSNLNNAIGNIIPNGALMVGKDTQFNPPDNPTARRDYIQGSFPLPILDLQQGEIARLKATGKQLGFELVSQENVVRGQVALAYRKLVNTRENIRKYQDGVIAKSERVAELGRVSYKLGQTDITAALTAQQANIQIRNLYLTEILNYQQAFTDLEQAVGHLLN